MWGSLVFGYAIGSRKKLNDICEKIDSKVDELSKDVDVDVPEKIIQDAVDRAVNREVRKQVDRAVATVISSTKSDINNEVCIAVKAIYPDIRKSCIEKVTEEVSKINVRDLKDAIREDAREKVAEKFDGQLDDIIEKFNDDLDNVSKIYTSIARKMSGSDSGKDLKISLG